MILDLFNTLEDLGNTLKVRVTTRAASNHIKVEHLTDGSRLIKVYVTIPPEDGKANKLVIALLAKELGLSKSSLTITHGLTHRDKTIAISH